MEAIVPALIFLAILFGLVILIGHGCWLALAWFFRQVSGTSNPPRYESLKLENCPNCNTLLRPLAGSCYACGWYKTGEVTAELFRDVAATRRQLDRLHQQGNISELAYQEVRRVLELEKEKLTRPANYEQQPARPAPPIRTTAPPPSRQPTDKTPFVTTKPAGASFEVPLTTTPAVRNSAREEARSPVEAFSSDTSQVTATGKPHRWAEDEKRTSRPVFEPVAPKPRRPFSEILTAFMEQSNIRWGEIIGGLLIIGCSTALVISLWNEISQIPLLKFFIFTSVTAALFGIGLYTEHRWKLPTTSRGILTIATLLVPLNFLAIAAVSRGVNPSSAVVLTSELIAPALFFCLVYFAGRIITPVWPHLLVFGVLGSSIGQLLERHFVYQGMEPLRLVGLGLFPVMCFVAATGWMLRRASRETEIDESLANTIFTTLGINTFASLLSLGFLLFKVGQARATMIHLAPLLTLGGGPIVITGLILWQRVKGRELAASRMAGTTIALVGSLLVVAGIALSFPNPASVVAAASAGFIIFSYVAIYFEQPRAHWLAAFCFALGFLVTSLAASGQVLWQSPPHTSLLSDLYSIRSGQAMAVVFVLFLVASEILTRRKLEQSGWHYLIASSIVGGCCVLLVTLFGFGQAGDPYFVAPIYALLAGGAFFVAWRHHNKWSCWAGSGVLLLALAQALGPVFSVRFPWQAAFLLHASMTSIAAIILSRRFGTLGRTLARPLNMSAVIASCLVILAMSDAYRWEPTSMYAQHLLWLAGIWLVLLWLNRSQLLFTAMQFALTLAVILFVKLGLQTFTWYAYQRNAWLHPWSLQIQGSVILLLGLAWMAVRIFVRRRISSVDHEPVATTDKSAVEDKERWADFAWTYLNSSWTTLDRVLIWGVLVGFVLMGFYSTLQGIKLELTIRGGAASVWNIAGFPHEYASGTGAWVVCGLLLVSMAVGLWERRRFVYVLGALMTVSVAVPLLAARWETYFASASALRWLAALFFVLMSLPMWWREATIKQLTAFGWPDMAQETFDRAKRTLSLLTVLTIVPVLALTLYPALKAIGYRPVHGPSAGFFFLVGDVISYSLPLLLIGMVLTGHALRERAAGLALAAGCLFNLAVTVAQLLTIVSAGGLMNRVVLVQVMQLNIIASSCFALVWLSTSGWWSNTFAVEEAARSKSYLKFQIGISLVLAALLIVPLALWLFARPTWAGIAIAEAGNYRGWLAIVSAFFAAFWFSRTLERKVKAWLVFALAGAASALVAFTVSRSHFGTWDGFHALLTASIVTAWLMLLIAKRPEVLQSSEAGRNSDELDAGVTNVQAAALKWESILFASIAGLWTVLMALRAAPSDPSGPWWSVGALIATSALAAGLNWETLSRAYLYAAAVLVNLAVSIWFLTYWNVPLKPSQLREFFYSNVIALSLPGIAWLLLELRARRANKERKHVLPSFHYLAAPIALGAMAFLVLVGLITDLASIHVQARGWLEWFAMVSAIALMTACLWDRRAKFAVAGLYLLGLTAIGLALGRLDLRPDRLGWMVMLAMAVYAVITSLTWKSRAMLLSFSDRIRIPARTESSLPGLGWLRVFNAVLSTSVLMLAFWVVLTFAEWPMRFAAAVAIGAQGLAFGLLAQGDKRSVWQRIALIVFALGTVFFGSAWLSPGASGTWLNRAVIIVILMFGMIALFGFGTDKAIARESDWTRSARSCIPWFAGTGALALLFVLVNEVAQQTEYGGVRINIVALAVVAITLLSASTLCILFAVKPEHDPLELGENGRMKYVYVAEALIALLFMHIRLTMPWLFTGFFEQYWPLVIVFLAFLGVGISEALRVKGVLVVARPVERTGAFLPLLPVIGFWILDSRVDYSLLLFMIGLLYGTLSILRRSFVFGILAALSGNGGLWYMLHQTASYGFLHHPQLWIIPVAVSVLIAAYLNRDSFTEEQMGGIRYLTLMMIYVSSTSDILINGVAESPWLPLALGGLSLIGVMCGIMFRVRAFLFLGATFLLIAVISMIWYASDNLGWTWLWWVAGIVTGALIIFTFALFEKKRGEMLQVLEDLRGWQK